MPVQSLSGTLSSLDTLPIVCNVSLMCDYLEMDTTELSKRQRLSAEKQTEALDILKKRLKAYLSRG